MSLFTRGFQEFTPLFHLLDDYATISQRSSPSAGVRAFAPKFDVKEVKDAYELHGELPGIDSKDVSIEWSDGNTLTISGRTETRAERGQRPSAPSTPAASSTPTTPAAVTETATDDTASETSSYHKPTVEDEDGVLVDVNEKPAEETAKSSDSAVTKNVQTTEVAEAPKAEAKPAPSRYWITERSVGQFQRSFSFPSRIDQDAVKASLKNGILNIVVPKAKIVGPRRISIE